MVPTMPARLGAEATLFSAKQDRLASSLILEIWTAHTVAVSRELQSGSTISVHSARETSAQLAESFAA